MATLWSDDFNRANETPLNATTWPLTGTGSFNLASNQASHPTDANDNEVYYSAASAIGDQWCQMTITGDGGASAEQGIGVVCRHIASGSTRTFIRAIYDTAAVTVRVFSAGTGTSAGSRTFTLNTTDVLRMEVTGTSPNIVIRLFKNGVQQGADFTGVTGPNTGKPGMAYSSTIASVATADLWSAGDFSVPSGGGPPTVWNPRLQMFMPSDVPVLGFPGTLSPLAGPDLPPHPLVVDTAVSQAANN